MTSPAERIREALEKMTPGPWRCIPPSDPQSEHDLLLPDGDRFAIVDRENGYDAEGIATLRNEAPALLDENERLRKKQERDQGWIERFQGLAVSQELETWKLRAQLAAAAGERERLRDRDAVQRHQIRWQVENFNATLRLVDRLRAQLAAAAEERIELRVRLNEAVWLLRGVLEPPEDGGSHAHYIERCDEARAFLDAALTEQQEPHDA